MIASIDSLGKTSFDTDSVALTKASLLGPPGGYTYFVNGAKPTAADTLTGLWGPRVPEWKSVRGIFVPFGAELERDLEGVTSAFTFPPGMRELAGISK